MEKRQIFSGSAPAGSDQHELRAWWACQGMAFLPKCDWGGDGSTIKQAENSTGQRELMFLWSTGRACIEIVRQPERLEAWGFYSYLLNDQMWDLFWMSASSVLLKLSETEAKGLGIQNSKKLKPGILDSFSQSCLSPTFCLTSSILSFPICKMEIAIVATAWNLLRQLTQCLPQSNDSINVSIILLL